jgi:transcriptional regulator with XRE-family HTH domain
MGQSSRPRPARLAQKLLAVRERLGFSQGELIDHLGLSGEVIQSRISAYECNKREPPLSHLLLYARRGLGNGIYLQNLIDDEMELPKISESQQVKQRSSRPKNIKPDHRHASHRNVKRRG